MTPHRFVLCDVFTDRPLAGMPLAVFTRATGLSDESMLALAREMNASETAFVEPPRAGGHARVRVFGPAAEVLEPGHSVLGTAVVLGGALQAEEVRLETQRGAVSVRLEREGARIVFGWVHEPLPGVAPHAASSALFEALELDAALLPGFSPVSAAGYVLVASSMDQLVALAPNRQALARLGSERICVYAGERGHYRARVFVAADDRVESSLAPAAVGAMAACLVRHEREHADANLSIESGAELSRPSLVHVRLESGSPQSLAIGGAAVVVGRGEVAV
ncbi:MAG TPA: PhzF family phenazine biosynthesis isomerase [Polyangiaceae bacterium]|nr:PhzF family phenazine biosynthesis isomerase [Polyangiaceae bacterium]